MLEIRNEAEKIMNLATKLLNVAENALSAETDAQVLMELGECTEITKELVRLRFYGESSIDIQIKKGKLSKVLTERLPGQINMYVLYEDGTTKELTLKP